VSRLKCIESFQRVDQHREIERNLNAPSKSPRVHHADLRRFVHLPQLVPINYRTQPAETSPLLDKLKKGLSLVRVPTTVTSGRKKNQSFVDILYHKANHVYTELGLWAAEHYIDLVLASLPESPRLSPSADHDAEHPQLKVSPKAQELIKFLVSQNHSQMSGILFVKQRVTASMLPKLLSAHPDTKHFACASFVGTSNPSIYSRCPTEIVDLDDQKTTLEDFRSQKCNMVIATNVLEEGIDISSCNLVVCFNKPDNLKSFIQRRGRAREKKSTFVLMLAHDDMSARKNWEAMEADMLKMFQEQQRKAGNELQLEDLEESRPRRFEIESTG
jgi:hypothetical protein